MNKTRKNRKLRAKNKTFGGGIIKVNGYKFLYSDNGDTIMCISKKALCFKIDFSLVDKSINIDISYSSDCSINKTLPHSEGTLSMMKAIFYLILSRHDINNYLSINLTDNSNFTCYNHHFNAPQEMKVSLVNTRFIATGCTWYSSLLPMFLFNSSVERKYIIDQNIIKTTTWGDLISRLPNQTIKFLNKIIIVRNNNVLAHRVFETIRKKRDICTFFHLFLDDIMLNLGTISSLEGKEWCIPLINGKIVFCPEINDYFIDKNIIVKDKIMYVIPEEYENIKNTIRNERYKIYMK
jgi:hypothetical protein